MPVLALIGNAHFYDCTDVGGGIVPSVTTILNVWPKGAGFSKWLAEQGGFDNAEKVKNAAGDRGTKVHNALDRLIGKETLTWNKEVYSVEEWRMIVAGVRWFEEIRPEVIRNESTIYSLVHGYAGTMDLYCKINGVFCVLDFKTSSSIHRSHRLQVNAYAMALRERGETVDQVGIIRVGSKHKNGYEFLLEDVDETMFQMFLHAKEIWSFENPPRKGKLEKLPEELTLEPFLS